MKRTKIKSLLKTKATGQEVCVKGWVRTRRGSKNVSFIALNDGSTINNIQIVAEGEYFKEDLKDFKPGINLVFNASGKYEKDHVIVNGHMITNSIGFPAYVQNIGGEFYQIDKSPFTNVQNHGWKNKTGSFKRCLY